MLNAAFERLQRSFEQSIRFSADASHHLKTPIAVLRAGVEEILNDAECSPHTQATAEGLLHRVHQLNSVADNLLLLARADAGRLEMEKKEFDLAELLEGVVDDARAIAEPLDLAVDAEIPEHLPVQADRHFIGIIAQNLLENAIKYNHPGGRVRLAARRVNGSVELTVANTGDGIPQERSAHLFERFYRALGDERVGGSGLGLSMAREAAPCPRWRYHVTALGCFLDGDARLPAPDGIAGDPFFRAASLIARFSRFGPAPKSNSCVTFSS